jgi:hypothetical protein
VRFRAAEGECISRSNSVGPKKARNLVGGLVFCWGRGAGVKLICGRYDEGVFEAVKGGFGHRIYGFFA